MDVAYLLILILWSGIQSILVFSLIQTIISNNVTLLYSQKSSYVNITFRHYIDQYYTHYEALIVHVNNFSLFSLYNLMKQKLYYYK